MTNAEAVPILARMVRELTHNLTVAHQTINTLEGRCHRLERAARERAMSRRHFMLRGHKDRV